MWRPVSGMCRCVPGATSRQRHFRATDWHLAAPGTAGFIKKRSVPCFRVIDVAQVPASGIECELHGGVVGRAGAKRREPRFHGERAFVPAPSRGAVRDEHRMLLAGHLGNRAIGLRRRRANRIVARRSRRLAALRMSSAPGTAPVRRAPPGFAAGVVPSQPAIRIGRKRMTRKSVDHQEKCFSGQMPLAGLCVLIRQRERGRGALIRRQLGEDRTDLCQQCENR